MLIDNRTLQTNMAAVGAYKGKVDGDYGAKSAAAARAVLAGLPSSATSFHLSWTDDRVRVGVEQWTMQRAGMFKLKIDGLAGPATQAALERYQDWRTFKAPPAAEPLPVPPAAPIWPRQADVEKFYGAPGRNQVKLESPYRLYLDWALSTSVSGFTCHEKIHDAALRVMQRVLSHYGPERIHALGLDQFAGCLNVRTMRDGKAMSMHSWGIAIDWDADRNQLRATAATAMMATPPYAKFLDLWEEEGFVSLGRARNMDYMHVQAARV